MDINYKGTPVSYSVNGSGRSLVLIHGFLESSSMWNSIISKVKDKFKVITIDLLGHGKSGNLGFIHSMEEQAKMIHFVLKNLKLRKYILVGHSMGGYVSLAFAELFNDNLKALVLLNSTSSPDSKERRYNRERAIKMVKYNHKTFIKMAIPNLFTIENRAKYAIQISELIKDANEFSVEGIVACIEGMKIRKNRSIVLNSFTKPKYILAGKLDLIIPFSDIKKEAERTSSHLHVFENGHMSHIEDATQLITIIRSL